MGNKGTVVFWDGKKEFSPATYLHWNGGPESIYGFLEELDRRKVQADQDYEAARFIQICGEFFDQKTIGGLSLGVADSPKSDNIKDLSEIETDLCDNGLYLVQRDGSLRVRRFTWDYSHEDDDTRPLREWTTEDVDAERRRADKSEYRPEFREFYIGLTKDKEIRA